MHAGLSELARAEARLERGGRAATEAHEILANVEAMELAVTAVGRPTASLLFSIASVRAKFPRKSVRVTGPGPTS